MVNIFYISLASMTKPLVRSQVLDYLIDLYKVDQFLIDLNYLNSFEVR